MSAKAYSAAIEIYLRQVMKTRDGKIMGEVVAHNARAVHNWADIVLTLKLADGSQASFKRSELTYATLGEAHRFHGAVEPAQAADSPGEDTEMPQT